MEDIIVTGIVLNSMPYKEKDRLIHIFSVELGNITGILKGVSSSKSKLKYAGQPFCMAKFELTKGHDFFVVKGVELIDSFYDISLDYGNFRIGSAMLEVCNYILKPNIISEKLFLCLVKSLKNLVYGNVNYKLIMIKFLTELLEIIGYKINFYECDICGMKFMGDLKFDITSGTFRCSHCGGGEDFSAQDFVSLKVISESDFDKLNTIRVKDDILSKVLSVLIKTTQEHINYKFKSI